MNKFIVTTTINPPTRAMKLFLSKKDWTTIIVGDLKTPHEEYQNLDCASDYIYLSPEDQEKKYPHLSELIGWKCIQRRNIGFVEAYKLGADVVATVDDDNIPYENWGENLLVGREVDVDLYETYKTDFFDPLSVVSDNLWHRGFPVQLLQNKQSSYAGKCKRRVLVQADLWDGDPDIDAIARITYKPCVKFRNVDPYCSNRLSPFNSQNTFLAREVLPYYSVWPHVGRMDDIFGAYWLQILFPECVVYNKATVYQERNEHDLVKDLENETIGYRNLLKWVEEWVENATKCKNKNCIPTQVPEKTIEFYKEYRSLYGE